MRLYITVILLALICPLAAMEPFDYNKEQKPYTLNTHVQYLEDKDKKFIINDISKKTIQWNDLKKDYIGFGFTSSAYWFKFCLNNKSDKTNNIYLEIDNPLIDSIELYIMQKSGQFELKKTGDLLPFNSRDVKDNKGFVFHLKDKPGINVYYIRIESTNSLRFKLILWPENSYKKRPFDHEIIFFILLIVLIIFSCFLFVKQRKVSYIFYILYIMSFLLMQLSMSGYAFQLLWPQSVWMANKAVSIFSASLTLFCGLFFTFYLKEEKRNKVVDIIIHLLVTLPSINILIFSFFIKYVLIIKIIDLYIIFFLIFLFILSLILSIMGSKVALSFLMSIIIFFIGFVIYMLKAFGILPIIFITEWSFQIALFISFIIQLPIFVKPLKR